MTRRGTGVLQVAGCVLALAACACAQAGSLSLRVPYSGSYAIHVTSLKEARFKTTVPQQRDFSCGSAAVATLLTSQYATRSGGRPVGNECVSTFRHRGRS